MFALSSRGVGAIELLRELLPEVVLSALALSTWLGSIPFLVGLSALVYWYESRDGGAFALAAVLGAYALTTALKATFGLPRPPESLWLVGASGFGFPSGHAIAATVGWGSLATVLDRGTRRTRIAVAAVFVAIIVISRVAIGVHYAVDVVAGLAVGLAYLGVVTWLDDPGRVFGVGAILALLAAVLAGGGSEEFLVLGATTGGFLVWTRFSVPQRPWDRSQLLPGVVGAAVVGSLSLVGYLWSVPKIVAFALGTVAFGGLLGLPVLVDRLSREGAARRVVARTNGPVEAEEDG